MGQEEIVNEIRKKCGRVDLLPAIGWHFIYHKRHYMYLTGKHKDMLRFCVPHVVGAAGCDGHRLAEAINETNKRVKFIKAVKMDCGGVLIDYDHKTAPHERAGSIVPHIINALDYASVYLLQKLHEP
ncbi:MAG: hypothetical protein LUB83_02065 [Prevotellaceae bacterium]|nr:hypothetical protein [Prevotellaceae bacterium]